MAFCSRLTLIPKTVGSRCSVAAAAAAAAAYHSSGHPSHMRAAVFWEPNQPLTIEEFVMPRPKLGEILLKTKACGVCHSDLHVMKGELPFARPCVLGHEITGEVIDHGPSTDAQTLNRFPVGAHVIGAFIMPCGHCFFCSKGEDDLCEAFFAHNRANGTLYDGETRLFLRRDGKPVYVYSMGGLAEYCVVPSSALCPLPESLPYAESSILGCAAFTAYGAMAHAAGVRPGDSVAVIGIGGVGSSCLQLARAFCASDIIAVDVRDEKLRSATALGATHTINASDHDPVQMIREVTNGRGVDVAVEALGMPRTFSQCVESVCDGGKAVMIGLAKAGDIGEIDINRLVRRKIKVVGSYGARARHDLPKIVKLAERGIFDISSTVSRKCKLEEAIEVYEDLNKGRIVGRAVVELM